MSRVWKPLSTPSLVCRTPCRSGAPKAVGWSGLSGRPIVDSVPPYRHMLPFRRALPEGEAQLPALEEEKVSPDLLEPDHGHRIDAGGAECRSQASGDGRRGGERGRDGKRHPVSRTHPDEQRLQPST